MGTTAMLVGAGAAGVAVFAPASASAVPAIPAPQQACGSPFLTLSGGTGPYHSMGLHVRINNGSVGRDIVAFVSMDANVSPDAEMRLSWKVGHGSVTDYRYGPGNIAENQQFDGTRTVMDVLRLGPGRHTLTPEVRLSGNSSTSGQVLRLCVIAEARTS
jgi:hypothetical protein